MNRHQLAGKWKAFKGKVRATWGKLTHKKRAVVGGKRDQLVGRIHERFGSAKAAAKKQVKKWRKRF